MNRKSRGFTLVELIATLAVTAVLAALVASGATKAIQKSKSVKCASNLRQLGMAAFQYAVDNNMCLPVTDHQRTDARFSSFGPKTSWKYTLQDYAGGTLIFRCPIDEIKSGYTYVINNFLTPTSGLEYWRLSRLEKPSRTFLFAERSKTYGNADHLEFSGSMGRVIPPAYFSADVAVTRHNQAANYVFADGHMETLRWARVQELLKDLSNQFVEPLTGGQPNQLSSTY